MRTYRSNGAIGALLDEYERAIVDLQQLLDSISPIQLSFVVGSTAEGSDCKSIQSVLTHVVRAGFWYIIEVRKSEGEELEAPQTITYNTKEKYKEALSKMFNNSEQLFKDYPSLDLYKQRAFRWPHLYNVDLLLEHAIVHILRHRRQIERFLLVLEEQINNQVD